MAILKAITVRRTEDVPQPEPGPKIGPEDLLPPDLMRAVWKVPPVLPDKWREHCSPEYQAWSNFGSQNWPPLAAATRLYVAPDEVMAGRDARQWWRQWFRWQLGRDADAPGVLGLFQGTEAQSNNYDGLTVGAICAVRLWAVRNVEAELLELSGAWLTAYAALAALGAMPWPTSMTGHGSGGSGDVKVPQGISGAYRVQIGGRSTNQHYADDSGSLFLTEFTGWPGARHPWPPKDPWRYWYFQVVDLLQGDFGVSAENQATLLAAIQRQDLEALDKVAGLLAGLRFAGWEIHRWPGASAGVLPQIFNGNTAAVMGSVLRADGSSEHLFPWPKPKPGNLGSGKAWIEEGHVLRAESAFGKTEVALPPEPPVRRWVLDREGIRAV